ncbi:MAG: RNA 2',3'-cyclic phosphodiesterase [Candidatus Cohnella colombiensis]|uniref:RNA 2',3'-cyclic phosphodiesterase n=1 Tax=Candidatus Cohnella colombiensis TaxID=3121368 RepID=A0AA95EYD1_9BACL|nr:MAG: RNA 2',3'-cyclic phosphodiesterase [Cohnella sp.]
MSQTMRLFVALPIHGEATEALTHWTNSNKENLAFRKWTHPLDYHITLQFLGDTSLEQVNGLQTALSGIKAKPFALQLNGAGYFGSSKSPSVLWAGVAGMTIELINLHELIIRTTHELGFEVEKRKYSPHITLARNYTGMQEFNVHAIQTAPIETEWKADRFTLMKTHMHATPMYEPIGNFPLLEG